MRSIIGDSFEKSFSAAWKNKSLFLLLVIVQVFFLVSLFFVSVIYQTKILERMKSISDYMASQEISDVDLAKNILEQKDILGPDIAGIGRNFGEIQHFFRIYLALLFLICLMYFSAAFSLAHKILGSDFAAIFPKAFIVSFSYLTLIFLFFYSIVNISMSQLSLALSRLLAKYVPFLVLAAVLAYFMFISLSIIKKAKLSKIIQKTIYVGIKKIHYVMFVYFLNAFLVLLFSYLVIYFTEKSVLLTLFFIVALLKSLAFGKIFIINLFEKLSD